MDVRATSLGFGALLYELRAARHLSVAKASSAIGMSAGYYCELENSKRAPPKLEVVIRMAKGLLLTEREQYSLINAAEVERLSSMIAPHCPPHVTEFICSVLAHRACLDRGHVQDLQAYLEQLLAEE
ncbi:helix-turn-helix domain-containing protein [Comamonas thiooxydans]|uniref:helix-turn-helix domain-containing protein n=1 Tax=Comamonas thiooxydans TaxID=363952 RepID=UPI0009B8976E